jgi:hypothetical protein
MSSEKPSRRAGSRIVNRRGSSGAIRTRRAGSRSPPRRPPCGSRGYGILLTGAPAWLLWRAYYLLRMPTLGRKLRIWVEWTWSLFFPLDVTHLRFTRSAEVDAPPALSRVNPTP